MTQSVNDLLEHISKEHLDVEDFDQDIDHDQDMDQDLDMIELDEDLTDIDGNLITITKPKPRSRKRKRVLEKTTSSGSYDEPNMVPKPKSMSGKVPRKMKTSSYTIRGSLVIIKGICCKLCNFKCTSKDLMNTHLERKHNKEPEPKSEPEKWPIPLLQNDSENQQINQNKNFLRPMPKCKQILRKAYNSEMYPIFSNNIPPTEYKQPCSSSYQVPDHYVDNTLEPESMEESTYNSFLFNEPNTNYEHSNRMDAQLDLKYVPKVELNNSNYNDVSFVDGIVCWFCKASFESVIVLNSHINQVHYAKQEQAPVPKAAVPMPGPATEVVDSTCYCFLCNKQFKNKKVLIEHNFQKHAEKHLPCDQCNMMFSRQSHLTKHLREKHILINVKCKFCYKTFASVKTLQPHLLVVHEYRMQKNEEHLFASDENVPSFNENHALFQNSQGESTENGNQIPTQMQNASTNMSAVSCPQCPRIFKNNRKLYAHRVIAHEEKTIMCSDCGATFARQNQLRRHIRFKHDLKMNVPCPHCDLVLFNEISLYRHNRIHHKDKRFPCQYCSQYFAKREELKEHHAQVHPEITTFKCPACPKELSTYTRLIKHERSEHQIKPYECTECTAKYSTNQTLQKHIIVVHRGEEYTKDKYASCTECNKLLFSKWHLRRHMVNNHSGPNTIHCTTCFITFQTGEELDHHITHTHPITKFQCEVCKKEFNNKSHYTRHTRITHPNPDKRNCDICNQIFDSNAQMKEHLLSMHPLSKYECALCQKEFLYKWHLKRHVLTVHSNKSSRAKPIQNVLRFEIGTPIEESQSFASVEAGDETRLEQEFGADKSMVACDLCQKMYSNKWHLRRHFITKHSNNTIEKVPCEQCDSTFASKWHLNRHIDEKHSAIEKFECNQCPQRFTAKRLLKSHIVREHEKAKFQCEQCDMKFNKESRLVSHTATHYIGHKTAQVKIQCSSCPRSFNNDFKLQKHQASAHKDKVKSCKICHDKFSNLEELKTHRQEMHTVKKQKRRTISKDHFVEVKMEPHLEIKEELMEFDTDVPEEQIELFCSICQIDFQTKQILDLHNRVVHRLKLTTCKMCNLEFSGVEDFMKHITKEHNQKKVPKAKSETKSKPQTSFDKSEGKKYICEQCSLEFNNEARLNEHVQSIHYEESLLELKFDIN